MFTLIALLPLSGAFLGCTTNPSSPSAANEADSKVEKKSASEDNGKAMKKISMAIGEEVGRFTISSQQDAEAPTGYKGTQYTVKTKSGKTFKCEIIEPSGFGKAMTWGMASGAGAMCTDFTAGSKDKGQTNKASCNALLQAAGKC
jgi:hypothetical protein